MSSILQPGFLYWDGFKYTISNPNIQGLAGGDLLGAYPNPTVVQIQGRPISSSAPSNNQTLTWNASNGQWQPQTFTITVSGPAGGDLGGTYPNPSVVNIYGASVPIAGALNTGNVLQVNGTSSLTYAPVDLSGGSTYVTGTLPASNQASQNMSGDVSGVTDNAEVIGLLNHILPSLTSGSLSWNGSSWVFESNTVIWSNDLSSSSNSNQYVASISGSGGAGGSVTVNASNLSFANTISTPSLSQNARTSDAATTNLIIEAQSAYASASSNIVGGNLFLISGAGVANGSAVASEAAGQVVVQTGGASGTIEYGFDGYGMFAGQATISVATSGIISVPGAQVVCPYLVISGNMSGSVTLEFPCTVAANTTRIWYADVSGVTFNSHNLNFSIGTGGEGNQQTISSAPTGGVLILCATSNNVFRAVG